jgi:5'-deoxynucleotidase YfbR-like HD superfamily hydrolase
MLAIELNHGRYTFDVPRVFRLMLAFPTHDMGEGKSGDVTYDVKNDDRVKGPLKEIEDEFVDGMYSKFPDVIRDAFRDAYAVEDEGKNGTTLEGRFFNAVERIGYMVFAVPQVRKHKRMSFVRVFRNHHAKLLELSQEFESVRIMYEPYIEFVEDTLRKADAFAVIDDDE